MVIAFKLRKTNVVGGQILGPEFGLLVPFLVTRVDVRLTTRRLGFTDPTLHGREGRAR